MSENFISINEALESFLNQAGLGHVLLEVQLQNKWEDLMGPQAAQVATLKSLRGWKLRIQVRQPAWRQELHFQQAEILKKANQILGGNWIKEIILC